MSSLQWERNSSGEDFTIYFNAGVQVRNIRTLAALLILASLSCAVPGLSSPQIKPLPTFDANSVGTMIAQTAAAAQTQTALKIPTGTITPRPTQTPSQIPTSTPTFLWALPTITPFPTFTLPPVATEKPKQANPGTGDEEEEDDKKNKDEDPRKLTGKQWSCVVLGTYPPRKTIFRPGVRFTVQWTVFNAGTETWGINDIDLIYKAGFRNEGTKIQDLYRPVGSGGEIKLYATFVAPKKANEYQSFFHLTVGRKKFCPLYYVFLVEE